MLRAAWIQIMRTDRLLRSPKLNDDCDSVPCAACMQEIIGFCAEARSTSMVVKLLTGSRMRATCEALAGRLSALTDMLLTAVGLDTAAAVQALGGGMQEALDVLRRQAHALVRQQQIDRAAVHDPCTLSTSLPRAVARFLRAIARSDSRAHIHAHVCVGRCGYRAQSWAPFCMATLACMHVGCALQDKADALQALVASAGGVDALMTDAGKRQELVAAMASMDATQALNVSMVRREASHRPPLEAAQRSLMTLP